MPFINIPSYGSASWKDPVADPASLPASGNELGDARVTESTSEIYVWDGSAWQNVGGSSLPAFDDDKVLYSTSTAAEWRIVGTGSTTAAYPADTIILGRTKPATLSGIKNILIGVNSGGANLTTGTGNVCIGYQAVEQNNGNNGVVIGNEAQGGSGESIAIGYQAYCAANQNTAIGYQARAENARSTAIGRAAQATANGDNIAIGNFCRVTGTGSLHIGSYGQSNTITVSNAIGLLAPATVANSTLLGKSTRLYLNNMGAQRQFTVALSENQIFANSYVTGGSVNDGDASTGILSINGAQGTGTGTGGPIRFQTAPAGLVSNNVQNALSEAMRITGEGNVGIGTTTPSEKLEISGNAKLVSALLDGSVSGTLTQSAADTTTSYQVKWPSAQGGAGTFLENDGSGNLSWGSAASYPAFSDDQVLYSTTSGVEWRTVGTGSTTAAYPADTVIVGRAKPASLTGADNILIGTTAGTALTNQTRLIAIGKGALDSMSGASDPGQIAIGYDALTAVVNPTTGGLGNGAGSHVAIGYRAGVSVTGGRASVYIGDNAGGGVTGGGQNVMVGPFAGNGNANQSIFIGYCAGRGASGSYNTVIGGNLNAFAIGSGSSNVGLGYSVFVTNLSTPGGAALTSGSNNTFLGSGSTSLSATQSNSIALGYQCVTGANEFSVGSSNAQINTMLLGRGGASQTVANAVTIQTMRASGTDTDMSVGTLTIAGAQGTGTGPGGDVIIATAAPSLSSGSTLNNHVEVMRITDTGLVGIQTSTPSDPLTVQGSINYTTGSQDYKISPAHHDHGTETTNFTINWSTSPVQTVTLNGTTNAVVTLQNAVQGGAYVLRVIQGATPGTIDFTAGDFADAVWPGGTPPTLSSTTGDVDLINLLYIDDGGGTVTYYGTFAADFS